MIVDNTKRSREWLQGWNDYKNGVSETECPYEDEYKLESWYEGWTWAHDYGYFGEKE